MYTEGNPVNFTDPSGHIVKRAEIGTNFFYSCNCGWIDLTHANPDGTIEIINRMLANIDRPKNINVLEEYRAIRGDINTPYFGSSTFVYYVVKERLSNTAGSVLGLKMNLEERRENLQCIFPINKVGKSCYSEEDLSSDLIGFYMAINNRFGNSGPKLNDARKDDFSFRWLAQKCGMPEDKVEAKEWSIDVFDNYGPFFDE
jgi:hypothetical protein